MQDFAGSGNSTACVGETEKPALDLIGLFGPLANLSGRPRNRKAADWAGTRINGQIEKFARNEYQIAGVIAIAGGADV